jgi:hypothetical protein
VKVGNDPTPDIGGLFDYPKPDEEKGDGMDASDRQSCDLGWQPDQPAERRSPPPLKIRSHRVDAESRTTKDENGPMSKRGHDIDHDSVDQGEDDPFEDFHTVFGKMSFVQFPDYHPAEAAV